MRLTGVGRAADLQWFTFAGGAGSELSLHLLCPWRVVAGKEILVGHGDYWRPAAPNTADGDYDRGAPGSRWRDVRRDALVAHLGPGGACVESVEADAFGGFILRLEGRLELESFPDATSAPHDEVEFWRLFRPGGDGEPFVVSSAGIDRVADA